MSKRRRVGIVSVPCPNNPGYEHPIGVAFEESDDGEDEEVIYSDRSEGAHLGYSRKYAEKWEQTFGTNKKASA